MSFGFNPFQGFGGIGNNFNLSSKPTKLPTMDKGQSEFWKQFLQKMQGLGEADVESQNYLRELMDPNSEAVKRFTDPYMREFNEQTIPGLAERFAGMGAMGGGLSSSGFGQSLGAAGAGLQEKLAALKSGLGTQAANQLMGQYGSRSGTALGTQSFGYQNPQQGIETILPMLAQILPFLMA